MIVPPTQAWTYTPTNSPIEWTTNAIWRESSLVGDTINAWMLLEAASITYNDEIVKAPVLPVPDWAFILNNIFNKFNNSKKLMVIKLGLKNLPMQSYRVPE